MSYWEIFRYGAGAGIRDVAEAFLGSAGGISLLALLLLSSNKPPVEIWVLDSESRLRECSESSRRESLETFGDTSMNSNDVFFRSGVRV